MFSGSFVFVKRRGQDWKGYDSGTPLGPRDTWAMIIYDVQYRDVRGERRRWVVNAHAEPRSYRLSFPIRQLSLSLNP